MIRYAITQKELEARISALDATWLTRARARTRRQRKAGRYEGKGIWSEIKRVYMELQHYKCAYCERSLEMDWSADVEHDVEHFRPKGAVTPWPDAAARKRRGLKLVVRTGSRRGYPLLAHSPLNYLVSCKVCNTAHKANHFPIAGTTSSMQEDVLALNARERPLLLFPLGDWGDEPEQVLTFEGCVPLPAKKSGHGRRRAQVCIELFELDTRGTLLFDRALALDLLWFWLDKQRTGTKAEQVEASVMVEALTSERSSQAACARAFVQLYHRDLARARAHRDAARELLQGKEPKLYEALFRKARR
jgi:hypothetical protein